MPFRRRFTILFCLLFAGPLFAGPSRAETLSVPPVHAVASCVGYTQAALTSSDWAGLRSARTAGRFAFQGSKTGWFTHNAGQRWLSRFRSATSPVADATASAEAAGLDGKRLVYRWSDSIPEWSAYSSATVPPGRSKPTSRPIPSTSTASSAPPWRRRAIPFSAATTARPAAHRTLTSQQTKSSATLARPTFSPAVASSDPANSTVEPDQLRLNGKAIYYIRPFSDFGEGSFVRPVNPKNRYKDYEYVFASGQIRFTTKRTNIYATFLGWPGANTRPLITSLKVETTARIKRVSLLGAGTLLQWEQSDQALQVSPAQLAPPVLRLTVLK